MLSPRSSMLQASFILPVVVALGYGQDTRPSLLDPASLLVRVASERESIVQYQCRCTVNVVKGKEDRIEYLRSRVLRFEYSRIDDHFIVFVTENFNQGVPTKKPFTRWSGRSGKYWFEGDSISGVHLQSFENQKFPMHYFDVRGIGMGFCGDFFHRTPVEKLIHSRKESISPAANDHVIKTESGNYILSNSAGSIEFDPKKSFWPVHLAFDGITEVKVQIGQKNAIHVPTSFELSCYKEGKPPSSVFNVDIRWDSINEPMSIGRECAERIATEFNVRLNAASDTFLFGKN